LLSSQVFFPDVERCEWLNKILKQIWPNANHYARNMLKEVVEPNVQKALQEYKLNGFKFDRMILGSIVSAKFSSIAFRIIITATTYIYYSHHASGV
jgi:Ca2+-dependent lipid-binding protein